MKTRVPSIPSQLKVWCGILLTWFQEIFWVRNQRLPAALMICGRAAEYPKVSGSHASWQSTPNSARKKLLPSRNCRAMASPPGMLESDSTHIPPTGTNWPARTLSRMRPKSSG